MNTPSPCHGAVGSDGIDRAHCMTCARYKPDATGFVLVGKTFRHGWLGSIEIVECLDRLEIAPAHTEQAPMVSIRNRSYEHATERKAAVSRRWAVAGAAAVLAAALLAYAAGAQAAQCGPWEPARDPYQGDQAEAVMRLAEIPAAERRLLADMVRQQYGWQRVMVSRSGMVGAELADLRSMNYGNGRICAGAVDRSAWPAGRHEAARAYTTGRWSVLVFDSCRNVALATNTAALPPSSPYTPQEVRAGYRGGLGSLFGVPSMSVAEPSSMALAIPALLAALAGWRARA